MSTMQEAWNNFQEGVRSALHQWTALRLAVENSWGGGGSKRKAELLQEELIHMFKTKKELYRDEVEDFLADYLDDNFSTYAEDGSPGQVAAMLVDMFAQCGRFDYTLANAIREEEQRRLSREAAASGAAAGGACAAQSGAVARSVAVKGGDDDDGSSDEDDDMGGAATEEGGMEVEDGGGKAVPDADGWETVPSKKGKGRRR